MNLLMESRSRVLAIAGALGSVALLQGSAQAQNAPVTINVDVNAGRHAISPLVYGLNYAGANAGDLNCPINRYGGNNTSRYNWQANADNRANDWFYESIAEASATPGERTDTFFSTNKQYGTQSMITVPIIGWVAKVNADRSKRSSFSVAKYGAQQSTDAQWYPDAGNGVKTNGTFITGNDPNDANIPADTTFMKGWVQHLVSTFGAAGNGGVGYYVLDNEPSLWHSTHRDVFPTGVKMDDLFARMRDYAVMIKSVDPSSLVVGPEEWGWSGYFYSGYDQQYGSLHGWSSLPDRTAHGGADFVPWLLQQFKADQDTRGLRLLNVLSLHYYPQGGEFGNDTSSAMQLRRNRSTRSLWDPSYTDESWINDKVQLIPRMKSWVSAYYPGTKIALTEYNWGAEGHINGATAQADILGILGREGADIATRWTTPDPSTPAYKAIKMFRNYDGSKGAFGDTSVSATMPNPDNLSAFASQDSASGTVKVMVISKVLSGTTPVTLNLSNFVPGSVAQVWQLTSANAITKLSDVPVTGSAVALSVPSQSITLFVIPKAGSGGGGSGSPTFTSSASASPSTVNRGKTTKITVNVIDTGGSLAGGIVDMEIYDASGNKVNQQYTSGQSFSPAQTRSYSFNWSTRTSGVYTVKVGVFDGTWATQYHWNNAAGKVTVK